MRFIENRSSGLKNLKSEPHDLAEDRKEVYDNACLHDTLYAGCV